MCIVDHGLNEGEPDEEYADQYRGLELENQYHKQELQEGFEDGKSNLILWCIFVLVFQTQPIGLFIKLHIVLLLKHGWMVIP